ncbi:uncharacterized protein [Dysidea avara]|uniref:uncharacterized protein n=1 Tax=Dysidea avara TaxID=196820 RepID=UPI00332557AE
MMSLTNATYSIAKVSDSSNFNIAVVGVNRGGNGDPGMINVDTPELSQAVPSRVMNLRNTSTTNDTIAISWDAATTTFCGNILKYYVTISYDDGTLVNGTSTEQKTHRFDGLQNNTCYIILALANNAAGNGTAIAMIVQTTGPQDDDDDTCSLNAAAVVGGVVGTFIITLVVTTLISVIITKMYFKHQLTNKKSNVSTEENVMMGQNVKMDDNPAYVTGPMDKDTIKMDTNPTYVVTK